MKPAEGPSESDTSLDAFGGELGKVLAPVAFVAVTGRPAFGVFRRAWRQAQPWCYGADWRELYGSLLG